MTILLVLLSPGRWQNCLNYQENPLVFSPVLPCSGWSNLRRFPVDWEETEAKILLWTIKSYLLTNFCCERSWDSKKHIVYVAKKIDYQIFHCKKSIKPQTQRYVIQNWDRWHKKNLFYLKKSHFQTIKHNLHTFWKGFRFLWKFFIIINSCWGFSCVYLMIFFSLFGWHFHNLQNTGKVSNIFREKRNLWKTFSFLFFFVHFNISTFSIHILCDTKEKIFYYTFLFFDNTKNRGIINHICVIVKIQM